MFPPYFHFRSGRYGSGDAVFGLQTSRNAP